MTFFRRTKFIRKKEAKEGEKRRSSRDVNFNLHAVLMEIEGKPGGSPADDPKAEPYEYDADENPIFTSHMPRLQFPGSPIRYTWIPLSPFAPEPPVLDMNHLVRSLEGLVSADIGLGYHTGWLIAEIPLEADKKHILEIRSVLLSLREGGRVGRPKGLPKPKKSGKQPLDTGLADRVYQFKPDSSREGKHRKIPVWEQIARQVLSVKNIPTDHNARERLRKKIYDLRALGRRRYLKK